MSSKGGKDGSHKFFSLPTRGKKNRVRKGLAEALGAIGLKPEEDDGSSVSSNSSAHGIVNHKRSHDSLNMSLFDHLKRNKSPESTHDKSNTQQPPAPDVKSAPIPRIITTTAAPSIVSRELHNPHPQMSRADIKDRSVSTTPSAMSVDSNSTIAAEEIQQRNSVINSQRQDKNKSAIMARSRVPTPSSSELASRPQAARGNHTAVTDAVRTLRAKLQIELKGSKEEELAAGVSSESFFGFIANERLRRMPAKGSRWDKILRWAEDFAKKLSLFEVTDDSFIPSSKDAVELILACLQLLLLLGPIQGEALERAFGIFHEYGQVFDFYKRNISLLVSISEARRYLSLSLADMLGLSVDMALLYRKSARAMSTSSTTVNFNLTFGHQMSSFVEHKDLIAELMWTWQLNNSPEITDIHVSIESIRQWLLPQDRMLQASVTGRRASGTVRAEFTCEWLDRPLIEFARSHDKVLTITAEAGAGKSFLFGWILERLQRRVGHTEYQAIQASIDSQVPAQATQIALVKSLLLQLLTQNVGNVALFRCLANVTELSLNTDSTHDAEDALWFTLDTALKGLENVVLVIDGLDALEGDEAHKLQAFEHLYDIASKNKNVRVIILTRPFSKPWPKPTRQITMTAARTKADVKHMARAYLVSRNLGNKAEIEAAADLIALRSNGSVTWADMAIRLLAQAKTITEITATVKELPTTTNQILQKHISTISLTGDARLILSWLLVSHRPLSTVEIQALLELDTQKVSHQSRRTNITEDIKTACGSLVIIQDKTVRFRNESIRLYLLELSQQEGSKVLLSPAEANKDLTARLSLYVTICLTRNVENSLEPMSSREVDALFKSHALLEYATRNWLTHFQKSSYYVGGQLQASVSELKGVFPRSTLFARLEQKCWEKQTLASRANSLHLLALRIRQQALGDNNQAVLQGCINVAQSYKKLPASSGEASKYFYQAAKIGQTVLGRTNDLAVACATESLQVSAGVKDKPTARTEAVTQREELLKYVIENEKHRYGANSALATKLNGELAELYSDIKENDKAEGVCREIYTASIAQNGQFSSEAAAAAEKLQAVLYKEAKHDDVVLYTQPIFENAERNLDIFDIRRVEITLRMADTYENKKDLIRAEELYISLWRGLTEYCRSSSTSSTAVVTTASISEAHQRKVQISIAYARFLRRQKRDAEAQNILLGVWLDYQHSTENKSEALVKQLSEVGEELKSMGIFDTAIAVFKSVWGYFKGAGKSNSAEAVGTAVSLMGAVQEKSDKKQVEVEKAKTAAAASGSVHVDAHAEDEIDSDEEDGDEEADAILDEIVKAAVSAPVAGSVSAGTRTKEAAAAAVVVVTIESQIQTCETLSSFYASKKQWSECAEMCAQLLKKIWPDLGVPSKYGFPKAYSVEAIKFARRLALAYSQSNQTEQAEKIYVAIFQSSLRSGGLKIQDEVVTESANQLIEFHRKTQQWAKVLAVYQQLLEGYKTSLGARNALTIKTLYTMGDLCVQYKLKGADRYYLELTKVDKSTDGVLSKDTLPAAIALSKIYHEQKRWVEARGVYSSIWVTFTHRAKEYNMSTELVQTIYKRYVTVLETHLKVHIDEIHRIAVEYYDTCTKVYGPQAEITLSSSLALVAISRKSPNAMHQEQAVKICEEVVAEAEKKEKAAPAEAGAKGAVVAKKAPSAFELSLLASAKRHLAALYTSRTHTYADKASGVKPVVSVEATQKAETLWKEQLEVNKKEHGVSHKTTLASLAALVGVWARSDKAELHTQAQQKLDVTVVEVISESCTAGSKTGVDSTKMHESATSLAKTYLSCGFDVQAWALLKQLRFHVVAKGKIAAAAGDKTTVAGAVQLPENIDRRSMVFIAAFEETLREAQAEKTKTRKVTFSDIMTDLLSEGILYDRYSLSIAAKDVSVEQKLFDGARLYVFLKTNNADQHSEQIFTVEESLFKMFMEKYGASIKTDASITRAFLVAIIEELGQLRHHEEDIVLVASTAGSARVHALLHAGSYSQAVVMATAWHQLMVSQDGFKKPSTIPMAFKLSLYLAGLGVKSTSAKAATDATLQARMLELSKVILRETLVACKTMNIDLVQLQASELNSLVRLMGQQKNYEDLEWLLTQLWNSRIIQSSWSSTTVISVGRCLVEVLFVRGKFDAAIGLAQAMAYNLRRTCGLLDSQTVEMNNLVSSLCVADRRFSDAMDLHEEMLRALLDLNFSHSGGNDDDDNADDDTASELQFDANDDGALDEERAASLAAQQLELVRRVYARNGGWPACEGDDAAEEAADMARLVAAVAEAFAHLAPAEFAALGGGDTAKWSTHAPSPHDTVGVFVAPSVWEFSTEQELEEARAAGGRPAAFFRRPSYMLRSLRISRQRSYGDISEARRREASVEKSVGGDWKRGGGMGLAAPVRAH